MSQQAQGGEESDLAARAADPSTPQAELHQLSASRPELRPLIAENPNAYPQLLEWLAGLGSPEVDAALTRRGEAGQTRPMTTDAESAKTTPEQTEEFGAVQQPHSGPTPGAQEPRSDFDQQIYGAPAPAAHSGPAYAQQPVYAQHPRNSYPPQGYVYTPAAHAEPETEPRRRGGGGCALVLLLVLITVGALVASYFVLFGNPLSSDEDTSPPAEEQQDAGPEEDQQEGEAASPEGSPTPTEEAAEEETDEDDEQARPAPDDAQDLAAFSAPSGNIHCTLSDSDVMCTIEEHFIDAPSGCDDAVTLRVGRDGSAETACDESVGSQGQNLDYGQTTGNGDFACEATETHFECWSQQSGNGFQLAREYYELYDY